MALTQALAIDRTLAALAEPARRRVVDLLRERPHRAGELARAAGLSAPAMSRHLRALRATGLVEESHPEFDARVRIYRLRPEPMAQLKNWLDETERLWTQQLAAFKAHVEAGSVTSRVIVSLRVAATPERAFEVFTRDIGVWWQPNDLFRFTPRSPGMIALEAGEGGRFTETLANGKVFEIGRVTGLGARRRLALTWRQATFAPDQMTTCRGAVRAGRRARRGSPSTIPAGTAFRKSTWRAIPFRTGCSCAGMREWWQQLLAGLRCARLRR